jgi:hypothetical protein
MGSNIFKAALVVALSLVLGKSLMTLADREGWHFADFKKDITLFPAGKVDLRDNRAFSSPDARAQSPALSFEPGSGPASKLPDQNQNREVDPAPPREGVNKQPTGIEMKELQHQIEALLANNKSLTAGMFFLDLSTGNYVDIHGDWIFPAASTIKLPILVAARPDNEWFWCHAVSTCRNYIYCK